MNIEIITNLYKRVGADVIALITEWSRFRMTSWNLIQIVMNGNVIIDGRSSYDCQELDNNEFIYKNL